MEIRCSAPQWGHTFSAEAGPRRSALRMSVQYLEKARATLLDPPTTRPALSTV